jgi:hypothetical protein
VVEVAVTSAAGTTLAYELVAPGAGRFRELLWSVPVQVEGHGMAVLQLNGQGDWWADRYGLAGRGADVTVWTYTPRTEEMMEPPGFRETIDGDAATLIAALRPATTEQWHGLLDRVDEHTPVLDDTGALADLDDRDVPPRPPFSTTTISLTQYTISADTTTAPR